MVLLKESFSRRYCICEISDSALTNTARSFVDTYFVFAGLSLPWAFLWASLPKNVDSAMTNESNFSKLNFEYLCKNKLFSQTIEACLSRAHAGGIHSTKMATNLVTLPLLKYTVPDRQQCAQVRKSHQSAYSLHPTLQLNTWIAHSAQRNFFWVISCEGIQLTWPVIITQ